MKTLLIAAIAVAVSGAAYAKDLKGTAMTDSEMDKVTAGAQPDTTGTGIGTATATGGASPSASEAGAIHGLGTGNKP
jgi:hypothetical protein